MEINQQILLKKPLNTFGLYRSKTPIPDTVLSNKMIKSALNETANKLTYYGLDYILASNTALF